MSRKAKYRIVMDGKGGLIVEKLFPWWMFPVTGSKYLPISNSLKDEQACDAFVARDRLEEAGKSNFGKVVKEYP